MTFMQFIFLGFGCSQHTRILHGLSARHSESSVQSGLLSEVSFMVIIIIYLIVNFFVLILINLLLLLFLLL